MSHQLTQNGREAYVRAKTIKLTDENIGKNNCDQGLAKISLYMTPKAWSIREKH